MTQTETSTDRPPRKKGRKTTKAEIARRVEQIVSMKIQGARASQIKRYVAEMTDWDVATRTIERYMSLADQELIKRRDRNIDLEFSKAMHRLEELYNKSNAIQDYKNCLQIQKEINEVLGFKTLEIRTTNSNQADLSELGFIQLFALKHGRPPTPEEIEELGLQEEDDDAGAD